MKKLAFLFLFLPFVSGASVDIIRIDPALFIHKPLVNFDSISVPDEALKRRLVNYLFDHDLLNHEGTHAFSADAQFGPYYQVFAQRFRLIDLDRDGSEELLFDGYVSKEDDREHVEIYRVKKGVPEKVYDELGHFTAYKIHPNTGEVLLFHHQYPCCLNASHNLDRLRLVDGNVQKVKRYFVARNAGDVKGNFFPEKVSFDGKYFVTERKLMTLRWSPEVIEKDAWLRRTQKNIVAHYEQGTVYSKLARKNGWVFVLVHGAPKQEESKVINPANFTETAIYGWASEGEL